VAVTISPFVAGKHRIFLATAASHSVADLTLVVLSVEEQSTCAVLRQRCVRQGAASGPEFGIRVNTPKAAICSNCKRLYADRVLALLAPVIEAVALCWAIMLKTAQFGR